jgi:hypothetical protein
LIITDNTYLENLIGAKGGVILALADSKVEINNSFITNVRTPHRMASSGSIFIQQCQYITITNCTFDRNEDNNVYADKTPINVHNTTFSNNVANERRYVTVLTTSGTITDSKFSESDGWSALGSGIKVFESDNFTLSGCTFTKLRGS